MSGSPVAIGAAVLVVVLTTALGAWFILKSTAAKRTLGAALTGHVAGGGVFLNKERQKARLREKVVLSPDTRLFRFALPAATPVLGLPVGKHFKIWCSNRNFKKAKWNNADDPETTKEEIERKCELSWPIR